jgi:paraquat-inducible protein A
MKVFAKRPNKIQNDLWSMGHLDLGLIKQELQEPRKSALDELHKKMYSLPAMHGHHEQTLLRQAGWAGWAWLAVLLATFFAQALALFVPFMSIKVVLVGNDIYSLPNSVRLMWESKIYVVAILIAFFSITFPFLKLAVLLVVWVAIPPTRERERILYWLCLLGKWSMLDPFIVILLMVLATDQWAVSTQTFSGVYLFLGSIASAIMLSTIATQIDRWVNPFAQGVKPTSTVKTRLIQNSGWLSVVGPITLIISAVCFIIALVTPYFQLNQMLLTSDRYSILQSLTALLHTNQPALAALVAIGLIIAPSIVLIMQIWLWIAPATQAKHQRRNRRLRAVHEWCMLEVFALGLLLFLWEGTTLMRTEVKPGLWIILGTIVIYYSGSFVSLVALSRMSARTDSEKFITA